MASVEDIEVREPADVPALPAPWLTEPHRWTIEERVAAQIRPAMFVYSATVTAFVEVVNVSFIRRAAGSVVFVDLADGRTLQFGSDDVVTARSDVVSATW